MSFVFNAIRRDFRRLHDASQSQINDSHRILSLSPLPLCHCLFFLFTLAYRIKGQIYRRHPRDSRIIYAAGSFRRALIANGAATSSDFDVSHSRQVAKRRAAMVTIISDVRRPIVLVSLR